MNTMTAADPADDTQSTQFDIAEAVRATALLADVTLSMWGAERTDSAIMAKVKADAGAVGNVGRAVKNVLAGADTEYRALPGRVQRGARPAPCPDPAVGLRPPGGAPARS
jgi:hypothetical protein